MLIAFTIDSNDENAMMDLRFGRCPFFALVDDQGGVRSFLPNDAAGASMGAGIGAAQELIRAGVEGVVTGQVGPKAMEILEAADIAVFLLDGSQSLESARGLLNQGRLRRYQIQRF